MKTTLKVAELASLLYALLCFGSYCINAIYYSVFGINISAYMSLSEILLLFLGQPILYFPILISVFGIIIVSNRTEEKLSIQRLYRKNAIRDDLIIILSSIILIYFVTVWYGMRSDPVIFRIYIIVIIVGSFFPGLFNAAFLFGQSSSEKKGLNRLKELFYAFSPRRSKIARQSRRKNAKKKEELNQDSRYRRLIKRAGIYRRLTVNYTFSQSEIKRLKWIDANSYYFYFILVFTFSLITMCIVNYSYALELKKGIVDAEKDVSYVLDGSTNETSDNVILVGESARYLFIYNRDCGDTYIINRDRIASMSIHNRYPSIKLRSKRLRKQMPEWMQRSLDSLETSSEPAVKGSKL